MLLVTKAALWGASAVAVGSFVGISGSSEPVPSYVKWFCEDLPNAQAVRAFEKRHPNATGTDLFDYVSGQKDCNPGPVPILSGSNMRNGFYAVLIANDVDKKPITAYAEKPVADADFK